MDTLEKQLETAIENVKGVKDSADAATKAANETKDAFDKFKEIAITKDEFDKQFAALEKANKEMQMQLKSGKVKSFADSIAEAFEVNKKSFDDLKNGNRKELAFDVKDITSASVTLAAGSTVPNPGIATQAPTGIFAFPQKPHLRNVLPTGTTSGAAIAYVYEKTYTPLAGYQVEGAVKTRVNATFETALAPVVTIAAILKVSRQALDDMIGLQSYINSQAPEKLLQFEDAEVLYGAGTANTLKGLFTAATAITENADDANAYDKFLTGYKQLVNTNYVMGSAVLMNAGDMFDLMKLKDQNGQYLFQTSLVTGTLPSINGAPIIGLPSVVANDFLVGDFSSAAQLMFREGLNIRIFEQNSNDVETNMLTIRVEERVALPIYRPYALAKGTILSA